MQLEVFDRLTVDFGHSRGDCNRPSNYTSMSLMLAGWTDPVTSTSRHHWQCMRIFLHIKHSNACIAARIVFVTFSECRPTTSWCSASLSATPTLTSWMPYATWVNQGPSQSVSMSHSRMTCYVGLILDKPKL